MPSKQAKQKTDHYQTWVNTQLDQAQLRAFASQCGLPQWRDAELPEVKKLLCASQTGRGIFIQTFGDTEVSCG